VRRRELRHQIGEARAFPLHDRRPPFDAAQLGDHLLHGQRFDVVERERDRLGGAFDAQAPRVEVDRRGQADAAVEARLGDVGWRKRGLRRAVLK
jgi:hypothetical protein